MQKLQIAVVGSGISGLSAAWLLSQRHEVTLFEAEDRLGGHANTVTWQAPEGEIAIDTGFIVYNEAAYPNLVALFDYLDVPTAPSEMGFGVSLDGGRVEYAGRGLTQLIGAPRNLADPAHWQMLAGVARFFRTAMTRAEAMPDDLSLGDFLKMEKYGKAFVARHLLPMAGAIWSSAPELMLAYPAKAFLQFFANHGLLKFTNRPKWRTVAGGSREYVKRLLADSAMTVRTSQRVQTIVRDAGGVALRISGRPPQQFDHVVVAVHADQALALLTAPTPEEREALSAFAYSANHAVLHRDPRLMPKRRRLWSSWNYVGDSGAQSCSLTYWMNALQPLPTATNIFVTLNPSHEPDDAQTIARFNYTHPIFDARAMAAQRRLWRLQGHCGTWFCGAHFGSGFHEDGLQAGLAVAEILGGLSRPWGVARPSGRIHVDTIGHGRTETELEAVQ